MLEIHQKSPEQDITIPDTSSGANHKQPNRNELPTSENENATLLHNAPQSKPK